MVCWDGVYLKSAISASSKAEQTTAQFRRQKDKKAKTRTNISTVCESESALLRQTEFQSYFPHTTVFSLFVFFYQLLETKMNENQQQLEEVHYMDNGYNYPASSECFMGFFGGVAAAPYQYSIMSPMQDQESQYWSMHMNPYKYGVSGQESTSYYGLYENVDHGHRMDFSRRAWDYPSETTNVEDHAAVDMPSEQRLVSTVDNHIPEGRSPDQEDAGNAQVTLDDDDIDPDTMTYEELLDLGEAVGTQSRGLSQELINQLPTSKHKSGGIFSRRKSEDRCVICQMRYKRGDRQIKLPCKHAYHTVCGTKWLSINKTCPVCNTEVFGDESSH